MHIVLSTDYHLAWNQPFDRPTEFGVGSRLHEIGESILWASEVGKKNKASMFLMLGDIFDRAEKLPTREGLFIQDVFRQVSINYDKMMAITGNHDMISENHNILDLFSETAGLKVVSKPSIIDIPGARLFFLPYIRDTEDFYAALNNFYTMDCPSKKYLFAHFWDASIMAVDPEAIDLDKINLDFFDRIFCGHYHVPTGNLDSKVVYLGTLLNKRFSEQGPKGCWILNTKNNKIVFHKNPLSPEFYNNLTDAWFLNENKIETNAYYRVACSPENVVEVSKILLGCKGFEIVNKQKEGNFTPAINLDAVEKKNNLSLKDYILSNCGIFLPSGISLDEFKEKGKELLSGM